MASRYIDDDNFEIQIQNCFSSMLNAIEFHHPFNRITALSKNDIVGLRLLEFSTFDSRLHDGEMIRPSYRYTYRLNGRYALTVSGEYSNDCFTVLLMITDRQTAARFGFKVKIAANSYRRKTLHIISKVEIFGLHCVINYNPDTNFYVFSIRPPLTDVDLDLEKTYAAYNECALVCLELDFVRDNVFYEVYNYGNESPFNFEPSTDIAAESVFDELRKMLDKAYKHGKANFKIDSSIEYEIGPNFVSDILNLLKSGVIPIMETKTLAYQNFCGAKDFNLNFSCTYGEFFKNGRFNQKSLSGGASYTRSLSDSFDFTFGGEYCDKSVIAPLMITHKKSGLSFGIELKFSFKSKKRGAYIVLKIPINGTEVSIKVNVMYAAGGAGTLASVLFQSKKNHGKKGGGAKGSDESNNGNSDDAKDDDHIDEKCAAAMRCDLIRLEVDFLTQDVTHQVYEYETIKDYAPSIEITKDEEEKIVDEHLCLAHVPKETYCYDDHYDEEKVYPDEELFRCAAEFTQSPFFNTFKKVVCVTGDAIDSVVDTVKEGAAIIEKKLPAVAVGGLCVVGGVALAVAVPLLALPASVPVLATSPMLMLRRRM